MPAFDPQFELDPLPSLESILARCLSVPQASAAIGERRAVIAFSGGPDSLALLLAIRRPARHHGVEVIAAHIDHGFDRESSVRARHAMNLARGLGARAVCHRLEASALEGPGGLEANARDARYAALERIRQREDACMVLTAHHADDQAETVLLRMQAGSGLRGLAGVARVRGHVRRPLLDERRATLEAVVRHAGLRANDDPGNRDLRFARGLIRHRLLPTLRARNVAIDAQLASIASRAHRARLRLDRRLARELDFTPETSIFAPGTVWSLDRGRLHGMPAATQRAALDALAGQVGLPYGPGRGVLRALTAQLGRDAPIGIDAGTGWRLEGDGRRLRFVAPAEETPSFVYDLKPPGRVRILPLDCIAEARVHGVEAWMFRSQSHRAALGQCTDTVAITVRNRRAGDRFRPLGCAGSRRLKDVLIDRHVPRHLRDRLPLVTIDDQVAWIPGIGIDHRFRVRRGDTLAVAIEINTSASFDRRPQNRNL